MNRYKCYPFRDKTAEKEDTKSLFIRPDRYDVLENAYNENHSCIINGNGGTGKTIILDNLKCRISEKRSVSCISVYETVDLIDKCYYIISSKIIIKE